MNKDLGQAGGPACANLTPYTLAEVDDTRPDGEPPAEVAEAVLSGIEGECRDVVRIGCIAHEASSCVCVEAEHEKESEVVGVPKSFEALLSDLLVGSGVHQDHDQQHEVAGDTARLGVMDLQGSLFTDFYCLTV